jgi:hypothetical protein
MRGVHCNWVDHPRQRLKDMYHFDNIKTHSTDFPPARSFLGTAEEAAAIPLAHKDQIFFLNAEAAAYIRTYLDSSYMVTGRAWEPFNPRYFNTVQTISLADEQVPDIKKWLFEKPIPFSKLVYLCGRSHKEVVAMTWKMVIKYWAGICSGGDAAIFDETLNWGLYYFHEDHLFFGAGKVYDPAYESEKAKDREALTRKFFHKNDLSIDPTEKQNAIRAYLDKYGTDRVE